MNFKNVSMLSILVVGLFLFFSCSKEELTQENVEKSNLDSKTSVVDTKTEDSEGNEKLLVVTTCPVMENPANLKGKSIEYKGYKVYFCCPGCDRTFKNDPDKFIDKIKANPKKYLDTR